MEYKLIKSICEEDLSKKVSEYLKEGEWKLYGEVTILKDSAGFPRYFYQAVISTVQK